MKPNTVISNDKLANISEIFTSIQGEGIFIGEKQLFIRFGGCNIEPRCIYCDTDFIIKEGFSVSKSNYNNPVSPEKLLAILSNSINQDKKTYHSISLTGGEPLLYSDFLASFLMKIKNDFKIYLETNGILYDNIKNIYNNIDYIAMDFKLPGECGRDYFKEHKEFLKTCLLLNKRNKSNSAYIFVKLVITNKTKKNDIIKSSSIIASLDKSIPLILQPVTTESMLKSPSISTILKLHETAKKYLDNVRIIPQIHKFIKIK